MEPKFHLLHDGPENVSLHVWQKIKENIRKQSWLSDGNPYQGCKNRVGNLDNCPFFRSLSSASPSSYLRSFLCPCIYIIYWPSESKHLLNVWKCTEIFSEPLNYFEFFRVQFSWWQQHNSIEISSWWEWIWQIQIFNEKEKKG